MLGADLVRYWKIFGDEDLQIFMALMSARRPLSIVKQTDFDVTAVDISECPEIFSGEFDVIILSHVLEHIDKPKIIGTLENLRRHLSASGKLVLCVPNAQANTSAYWAYEDFTHTTIFTSGAVFYVAKMACFEYVDFMDVDCTDGGGRLHKYLIWPVKRTLLKLYRANRRFWNRVTNSAYHAGSPEIYSYEIKAVLRPAISTEF
jgi:SAM-dependent methyltransferase